jgi:hypothetical protein
MDLTAPYKQEEKEKKEPIYTEDEIKYRDFLIKRMEYSNNERDKNYTELDDMNVTTYYDTNARAANSYVRAKQNVEDTRIVTGTTQEKVGTIISNALNYKFGPNMEAFDKDDKIVYTLGEHMEDMITKSREIEEYETERALIYKEFFDQGTCYVEEVWEEPTIKQKKLNKLTWSEEAKISDIKWETRLKKSQGKCKANLLNGKMVYLGNYREFYMDKQPYIFTAIQEPRAKAEAIYGAWERWQYVPDQIVKTALTEENQEYTYGDWSLDQVGEDKVEIIKYQDVFNNDFMIMINGVMMLPAGFPLEAISPGGGYNIAKGDSEPIGRYFALSKSIPAKTKVDQAVFDEMLRLIILKTQQSFKPPMANNTGRTLSKRIFYPGQITSNIDPGELQPLIDARGVTNSEFNAVNFIKGILDSKSISTMMEGQQSKGSQTATEISELKRQSLLKLGLSILGIVNLEKKLCELRLYNILDKWTQAVDVNIDETKGELKNKYKTISVNTDLEDGQDGRKIIEFTTDEEKLGRSPEQIMAEEDILSSARGETVRKIYMNPEILSSYKYNWFINITPIEKQGNDLDRVLFTQNIAEGFQLFGPQAFNMDYLKEQWAIKTKLDPDKALMKQQEAQAMQQQMAQPQTPTSTIARDIQAPARSQVAKPSINTLT